ncbi:MAG: LysM peptidoglycan-binding domain-containing protein, partial [Anaerolineales bacterium]|nr:LysM peptidoglycan-binding domain-containing protein [Anaerolineales bacterium]
YEVQAGDTWASIAAAQGTTAVIVMKANPGPLYVGRKLWVPAN